MIGWTRDEALAALLGRINYEATAAPVGLGVYRLRAISELLARLGHPELSVPFVHVAGTKGKGSTSTMIAQLLTEAGYRVGLYTSPHLSRVEERMLIAGEPIDADTFSKSVARVMQVTAELDRELAEGTWEGSPATFFDLLTATAWCAFETTALDVAVFEVGLGGRVDSTNAATPCVSVITPVSMDHMRQLGDRLELIAAEKAGIIKPGIPVVCGPQAPEAAAVIRAKAAELGSELIEYGRDFEAILAGEPLDDSLPRPAFHWLTRRPATAGKFPNRIDHLRSAMAGIHQVRNAAVAIQATGLMLEQLASISSGRATAPFSDEQVRNALEAARIAGRIERLQTDPCVIVDVAHNVAAIDSFVETVRPEQWSGRRTVLLAISEDKDAAGILARLAGKFDRFFLTRFVSNPRATDPQLLRELLERQLAQRQSESPATPTTTASSQKPAEVRIFESPESAMLALRSDVEADELIAFTGSTFLVAEVRQSLLAHPLTPVCGKT